VDVELWVLVVLMDDVGVWVLVLVVDEEVLMVLGVEEELVMIEEEVLWTAHGTRTLLELELLS